MTCGKEMDSHGNIKGFPVWQNKMRLLKVIHNLDKKPDNITANDWKRARELLSSGDYIVDGKTKS